jgi:hypothetical protein
MKFNFLVLIYCCLQIVPLWAQTEEQAYYYLTKDGLSENYATTLVPLSSIDTIIQYRNTPTPYFAYKNQDQWVEFKSLREEFYVSRLGDTLLIKSYTPHDSV